MYKFWLITNKIAMKISLLIYELFLIPQSDKFRLNMENTK